MSEASAKADAFVSDHQAAAHALGQRLADLIEDPEAFLAALREGLASLADPDFSALARTVSPGAANAYVVRGPLVRAIQRPLRQALRETSSILSLQLARHVVDAEDRDLRLFALPCLRRTLAQDPEQTWQLLRRMGRQAADWIEVDSLADVWARGVLAERFRWAELEQLLYSARAPERRLVGAVLATIPHRVPAAQRELLRPEPARRALELVRQLMGDADATVQKSLAWAVREWTRVDAGATAAFLLAQTDLALQERDGARAWVIRNSLSHQPPAFEAAVRERLAGLRRDPAAPSTSIAASQAAGFSDLLAATSDVATIQGERYMRSRA
jgi:3-methyladenine DNA glycosylase AlkD